MEHLFTPFYTTKPNGTGLGLAICHKIVSEHRGMIKVDSDPTRGTTFTVMLPLIQ
jgi:two-component system nitrogen regulation sensor histidine kinase GlnL